MHFHYQLSESWWTDKRVNNAVTTERVANGIFCQWRRSRHRFAHYVTHRVSFCFHFFINSDFPPLISSEALQEVWWWLTTKQDLIPLLLVIALTGSLVARLRGGGPIAVVTIIKRTTSLVNSTPHSLFLPDSIVTGTGVHLGTFYRISAFTFAPPRWSLCALYMEIRVGK